MRPDRDDRVACYREGDRFRKVTAAGTLMIGLLQSIGDRYAARSARTNAILSIGNRYAAQNH